ncbi:MAG: Deoxyhypusine synthase [Chrysothrix sp. TS-e1954]|nr:MAG: Deoxyhypusine synthase [Chrysothrix sp. TS-e1954]
MEVLSPRWPHISQTASGQDHDREDSPMPDSHPVDSSRSTELSDPQPPDSGTIAMASSDSGSPNSSRSGDVYETSNSRMPSDTTTSGSSTRDVAMSDATMDQGPPPALAPPDGQSISQDIPRPTHANPGATMLPDSVIAEIEAGANGSAIDTAAIITTLASSVSSAAGVHVAVTNQDRPPRARRARREASRRHSMGSMDSDSPTEDGWNGGHYWTPIHESDSVATGEDLERIVAAGETSALDHELWQNKTFRDLDDPDYTPSDSGRIEWTIARYNGTKESPQKELVMRSEPVAIGGYNWRIKVYPRGNESEFLAAYIENEGPVSDQEQSPETEELETPMPLLNGLSLKKPKRVPVQFCLTAYNPQEPRVHYSKRATHCFTTKEPDRGFPRFGPTYYHHLGTRFPEQRQALLQRDTLAFVAHLRVMNDPTSFLFEGRIPDEGSTFSSTGMQAFDGSSCYGGCASNLVSAVSLWSMMPNFRRMIYDSSPSDELAEYKSKPLVKAFQQLFCDIRRESASAGERDSSGASVDPIAHILTSPDSLQGSSNAQTYAPWHPAGDPIDDYDVVQLWCIILDRLRLELHDHPLLTDFESLFLPGGFRGRLPSTAGSILGGLTQMLSQVNGLQKFPQIMQVELARQTFDENTRTWKKLSDKVKLNDKLKLTEDSSGHYTLYGLVVHANGTGSQQFTPLVKADGRAWYKFGTSYARNNRVTRLTNQQALVDKEGIAYLAIYIRNDLFEREFLRTSPNFRGLPEDSWSVPERLLKSSGAQKFADWEDDNTDSDISTLSDEDGDNDDNVKPEGDLTASVVMTDPPAQTEAPMPPQDSERTPYIFAVERPSRKRSPIPSPPNAASSDPPLINTTRTPTPSQQLHSEMSPTPHPQPKSPHPTPTSLPTNHTLDFFNSGYYEGPLLHGLYHGHGRRIYLNGDLYTGNFNSGLRSGLGHQTFQNGDTYDGTWENDLRSGRGTFVRRITGNKYDGGWKAGKQAGDFVLSGTVAEAMEGCLVCYEKGREALFDPCGHVCACRECARQCDVCPVCRRGVTKVIRFLMV